MAALSYSFALGASIVSHPPASLLADESKEPASDSEVIDSEDSCTSELIESDAPTDWWRRPGGGAEVFRVAIPLVISSLSWTVLTFVDRVLLSHWSGSAMASSFIGSNAWWAMVCLPVGICSYTGTFVAQYHGSNQSKRIGSAVWQGVWFSLAVTPLLLLVIPFARIVFAQADQDPQSVAMQAEYFQILMLAAPGMLLGNVLSCFYSGRGKTVVLMIIDSIFSIMNLVLDYWWIFGLAVAGTEIFPAMGIAGAAWATAASLWGKAVVYLVMFLMPKNRVEFETYRAMLDLKLFRRMMYYGGPSGLQMLLDVIGFFVFLMMVAQLGAVEKEATSMAFSIGSLAFMPIVGFGMAVSILVGQYLGDSKEKIAAQSAWTSVHIAWAYMLFISILFVGFPELLLSHFFTDKLAAEGAATMTASELKIHQQQVYDMGVVLLCFVAGYNFLDAMLIVFVSAIKGAGDTQFVLRVSMVMASALAVLSYLAVEQWNLGIYGCWTIIASWIGGMGVVYFLRFLQGKWKSMRVIEMASHEPTLHSS